MSTIAATATTTATTTSSPMPPYYLLIGLILALAIVPLLSVLLYNPTRDD